LGNVEVLRVDTGEERVDSLECSFAGDVVVEDVGGKF